MNSLTLNNVIGQTSSDNRLGINSSSQVTNQAPIFGLGFSGGPMGLYG